MSTQENTEQQVEITKNFIDLNKVIAGKSPKLAKMLPGFIIAYLKRVVHQDEMNKIIYKNRNKFGVDFAEAVLQGFGVKVKSVNLENIPKNGRYLLASNHPLGGPDGLALMQEVAKVRKDFLFPVNDLLMNLTNLNPVFIPVNKHGSNADNIRLFNETFASDHLLLYFPAGLVSRKQKGKIIDLDWKKTFLSKAIKYKRDIIPVHIDGRNTNFFYNLANLRKRFGIKANLEMLYLVDEAFKHANKIITITFGEPIPYTIFDKRHTHLQWADLLKKHVYALGRGENPKFEQII
jgi:putative hemolysin